MAAQPTVEACGPTHRRYRHRRTPGPAYSEAARLLWAKLDKLDLTTAEAAEMVGVSRVTMNRWLCGDRQADAAGQLACRELFGIEQRLWFVKPRGRHALLLPHAKAAA